MEAGTVDILAQNTYVEVLRKAHKAAKTVKLTCDDIPGKTNKPFVLWCVNTTLGRLAGSCCWATE